MELSALHSPRLRTLEQAYLRSVVVDGQWTQLRKYRAARSLLNLATCLARFTRRHSRAVCGSTSLSHRERHHRPGTPCPTKRVGMSTEMAQLSLDKTQAARLGLWNAAFLHLRCRWSRALCPLRVSSNCARSRSTSRTAALLSKASTNAAGKPPRLAGRRGRTCGGTFGWGGLGDSFSVRKVKAHTAPEAVCAGVISAEERTGNDWADAACKLVVLEHRAARSMRAARHSSNLAVTCMARWIARVRSRGSDGTLTKFGFLGVGG